MELFHGHNAIEDFQAIFDMTWTDAMEQGGLLMNDVGKSFFLLRSAQLTERQLFDFRMRIDGDLSRNSDARQLLCRMFCDPRRTQAATVPAMAGSTKATFHNDVEDYYDTFGDY